MDGQKYGTIDFSGEFVTPPRYDQIAGYSDGLAIVRSGDRYGAVNRAGALVVELKFEQIQPFASGAAEAYIEGKCCIIDATGRFLVAPEYHWLDTEVRDGRRLVRKKAKFGYTDSQGRLVIPLDYDWAERFEGGIGRVGMDVSPVLDGANFERGKWGYIDVKGKWIWKPTE
jgi:hypothetical protein